MGTEKHGGPRRSSALTRARFSRALSILYFTRAAVSVTWVLIVSALAGTSGPTPSIGFPIWTLLVVYPITDAAATAIDIHTTPRESQTVFQRLNLATSLAAAGAVAATVNGTFATTLDVFGIWAIASGAIQLLVALRRNTLISAQWFMVISGAGSIFAGTTYLHWQGTAHDGITTLVQYSTGGALWYAITATRLLFSSHRHPDRTANTPPSPSQWPSPSATKTSDASDLTAAEQP
ncbi:MAG: hypothetical protein ACR2N4_03275 [Jatrophihabitans sp.]